jgi:hypothetical protein
VRDVGRGKIAANFARGGGGRGVGCCFRHGWKGVF